ncbi:hypothetical protein HYP99_gp039 [Sinorhizobium phage ort11]|uniref:Uncharacterized protein n=1 Tax=Sinorhizobium phage ort11 TaxID=2599764 RepID=A0A5C2H1A8_9CAUD|nr:hypothetical protein HYP99_gp039 [Sinorhizobium phage ort11]QEP29837.1 hypothetical protein Smphiort11_039 [Sinorhizobium phage ort11]
MRYPKGKSHIIHEYAEALGIPVVDIPLSKLEEEYEDQLPEWAQRKANREELQIFQQLVTLNPKARGNATILKIKYLFRYTEVQFIVGTDAGNIMKLTLNELLLMYEPGDYILKGFPNPKLYEKLEEMNE